MLVKLALTSGALDSRTFVGDNLYNCKKKKKIIKIVYNYEVGMGMSWNFRALWSRNDVEKKDTVAHNGRLKYLRVFLCVLLL